MAKKTKVQIKGTKELIAKLNRLSDVGKGAAIETALRAGAAPIQNAAQQKAPKLSGTLSRSIHTEVQVSGSKGEATVGTDIEYAAQREFGGTIIAKQAPYLVFRVGGRLVRVKSVTQQATPYLRPAFDEQSGSAVDEIEAALKSAIDNVI